MNKILVKQKKTELVNRSETGSLQKPLRDEYLTNVLKKKQGINTIRNKEA